jgi:hypothetical protein
MYQDRLIWRYIGHKSPVSAIPTLRIRCVSHLLLFYRTTPDDRNEIQRGRRGYIKIPFRNKVQIIQSEIKKKVNLPSGRETLLPIVWEAGWVPEPFWRRWWREKFPAPAGTRTPPINYHHVRNGSGARSPGLLSGGCRGLFPWGLGCRGVGLANRFYLVQGLRSKWSSTSTPQYVFMVWCSIKHRHNSSW